MRLFLCCGLSNIVLKLISTILLRGVFSIKGYLLRVVRLMAGLFLFALGIVMTLRADIGFAPWDVFHSGLAQTLGIRIGIASILTGLVLLIIVAAMKETLGLGTIFNMFFVGFFVDRILSFGIIPLANHFVIGVLMLISGLLLISLGSYFYISSAFGAGPRDSVMVMLARRTGKPVGLCRAAVELTAVAVGFLLGGLVGIGTVIAAIGIGFCVQFVFRTLKFNPALVEHESLAQSAKGFLNKQ